MSVSRGARASSFQRTRSSTKILEMICLNFTLDGATLVPEMRTPFDILVEGLLVSSSRGDRTPMELFVTGVNELTKFRIEM